MYVLHEEMARQKILDLHREAESYRLARQLPRAEDPQGPRRRPLLRRLLERRTAIA